MIDCCLLSRDQNFSYFQELRLSKETRGHNREIWLCNKPPTTTSYKILLVKSCCKLSFMYQRRSIVHAACTHFCPALGRVVYFIHGVQLADILSRVSGLVGVVLQNRETLSYLDITSEFIFLQSMIHIYDFHQCFKFHKNQNMFISIIWFIT